MAEMDAESQSLDHFLSRDAWDDPVQCSDSNQDGYIHYIILL